MTTEATKSTSPRLAALRLLALAMTGQVPPWPNRPDDRDFDTAFSTIVRSEGVGPLVWYRIVEAGGCDWPPAVQTELKHYFEQALAWDTLRTLEFSHLATNFSEAGLRGLWFKGVALAHQCYPAPSLRPRVDADLLVEPSAVADAEQTLADLGYQRAASPRGDLTFCQSLWWKTDARGAYHAVDLHWRLFNRPRYYQVFDFPTLWSRAVALQETYPDCYCLSPVDALLITCAHAMAHHPGEERLIWAFDVDRLSRSLGPPQWDDLASLAKTKNLLPACALGMQLAEHHFATPLGNSTFADPFYLQRAHQRAALEHTRWRRWLDDLEALPTWRSRFSYLREKAFPDREFMEAMHPGPWPLWMRYLRRALRGLIKVLPSPRS